jgi:stress response protein YsnF
VTPDAGAPDPRIPIGTAVVGAAGELLGHVGAVYVDNATGLATWAAVRSGQHSAIVPLEPARFDGVTLRVPFDARRLQTAPRHDPTRLISYREGDDLARHYGLLPAAPPAAPAADVPDRAELTRSEERLVVDTTNVVVGRARLVTYVVTEEQTFTVPVRRQEVRLVYEAVPDEEQTTTPEPPAESTYEVVLHAEEVLVSTRVVPVERVRMVRRVVVGEQAVADRVDVERVEAELVPAPGGPPSPRRRSGAAE